MECMESIDGIYLEDIGNIKLVARREGSILIVETPMSLYMDMLAIRLETGLSTIVLPVRLCWLAARDRQHSVLTVCRPPYTVTLVGCARTHHAAGAVPANPIVSENNHVSNASNQDSIIPCPDVPVWTTVDCRVPILPRSVGWSDHAFTAIRLLGNPSFNDNDTGQGCVNPFGIRT